MKQQPGGTPSVFTDAGLLVHKTVAGEHHAYELYDLSGSLLAVVHRTDIPKDESSTARKLLSLLRGDRTWDTVRLEVVDASGARRLTVVFPATDRRWRATVLDQAGNDLGEVVKARGIRKIHFDLRAGADTVGTVDAEGWSGFDFRIEAHGETIGQIVHAGSSQLAESSNIPITSEDYLLELNKSIDEPLATLVVACAVGMDLSVGFDD